MSQVTPVIQSGGVLRNQNSPTEIVAGARIDFMPLVQLQTTLTSVAAHTVGGAFWMHTGDIISGVSILTDSGGYSGNIIAGVYDGSSALVATTGLISATMGAFTITVFNFVTPFVVAANVSHTVCFWHAGAINLRVIQGQTFDFNSGAITVLPPTAPAWGFSASGLGIVPRGLFQ